MRRLIAILIALLVVGCGENKQADKKDCWESRVVLDTVGWNIVLYNYEMMIGRMLTDTSGFSGGEAYFQCDSYSIYYLIDTNHYMINGDSVIKVEQ